MKNELQEIINKHFGPKTPYLLLEEVQKTVEEAYQLGYKEGGDAVAIAYASTI